jgi:hypothetical protein
MNNMKEIFAITERRKEGQERSKHVLFGINERDLNSAKMFTEARQKINWDNFTWGLLCDDQTYEYIKCFLRFGGFDPYEIEDSVEVHLRSMKILHFYKEVVML